MFDFILFRPVLRPAGYGIEYFSAEALPKDVFASSADLEKARAIVKKAKYFHFQIYSAEQGFVKLMKEHGCTLVVALSDFFGVEPREAARRLGAARVLVRIAQKEGVRVRIFSLARNGNELRDEYEIFWIGKLLGISDDELLAGKNEAANWQQKGAAE
ncbi:MAG: hypothetical protein V1822_04185 [Candidatus Micrarchaeota archaeon]